MPKRGVIESSCSAICNSIVLVSNLRQLPGSALNSRNYIRWLDLMHTPYPKADLLLDNLGAAQYLSMLDLTKGYWQVSV